MKTKLRSYFESRGISVVKFATLAGLTRHTVRFIMNGARPSLTTAMKIYAATQGEVTPEDLFADAVRCAAAQEGGQNEERA